MAFPYKALLQALPHMTDRQLSQSVSRLIARGHLTRVAYGTYAYSAEQPRISRYMAKEVSEVDPIDRLPVVACALAKRPALQRAWA